MILLDTNLLGRMTDSADPRCASARRAVHVLLRKSERLIVVPQNLYEFWAVATRKPGPPPAGQNGLGMTPDQANQWLRFFLRRFTLLPDREELLTHWRALVTTHAIKATGRTMLDSSPPCRAMGWRDSLRSTPMTLTVSPSR